MASSSNPPPPSANEYGADEISALVLDPGYSTIRAGFAGEDSPKSIVPTYYGVPEASRQAVSSSSSNGTSKKNYIFDENALNNPHVPFEVRNPMNADGTVEDWDIAERLWEYAIASKLIGTRESAGSDYRSIREGTVNGRADDEDGADDKDKDGDTAMGAGDGEAAAAAAAADALADRQEKLLDDVPLLMTEPGWNPAKNREKCAEIALEDWGAPAFYLGRAGVLSAFASGKGSALVLDLGASNTSITPVHDGIMLRKGALHTPLAGNFISSQVRAMFSSTTPPVPLTPHYLISSKTAVEAGQPASATYKTFSTPPTPSFRRLQESRVLTEFKESCVQLWRPQNHGGTPLSEASAEYVRGVAAPSARPFEMPDGWNNVFGPDMYRPAEGLFDEKMALAANAATDSDAGIGEGEPRAPAPTASQTIPALCKAALMAVDVDVRPHLLSNVVLVGGSSLIPGMQDRVHYELLNMFPGGRVRVQQPQAYVEKKFAAWLGGSILASLGSFHQMWISKKEWDEAGPGIVERRCK